jgi:hypothetical protein
MAVLLLAAAFGAQGKEYTDVYYDAAESGWGFFLVQSDTFQFLAFFIYGSDGKPTWYVALLSDDGTGTETYTGQIFATTGTYFPLPWNPALYSATAAGTATFKGTDNYHATFTYTVNGVGTVTKPVVRQTLTSYPMAGNYSGSLSGSISGCANPMQNVPSFTNRLNLTVTQNGDQSATLTFTVVDLGNIVCTVSGPLSHFGRLYQMPNASYSCPASPATSNTVNALHPTGEGIEGKWKADDGGGCTESIHFSAVLLN